MEWSRSMQVAHPVSVTGAWRSWSLRSRFFLAAALALCVTVLMVVLLQSALASKEQQRRVQQYELPAQLQSVAASVQAQLNLAIAGSEALANHATIHRWLEAGSPQEWLPQIEQIMARAQRSLKANAVFLAASQAEGVRYYHYENGQLQSRLMLESDATNHWYFNFVRGSNTFELNLDSNPLSKQLLMFVNYRGEARRGALPAAVAGGGMGMEQLAQLIRANKVGSTGSVMLVRPDGLVDVHPDAQQAGRLNLRDTAGFSSLLANDWQLVREQTLPIVHTQLDGQDSYVGALYLPDLQRYLIAQMPMAEITQSIDRSQWLALGAGGALLLLGLVLLYPLATSLLHPLESLQRQIAAVTQSLNLATRLQTTDKAEIGRMCEQLNRFLERLHIAFRDVRVAVDGIHANAGAIARGNQDLSQRTETEAAALEHSASSMEELSTSVQQNAESAHRASTLSDNAAQVACQGGALMTEVVEHMHSIAQSSQRIGDIVGVIDSIAFQTNILALNAAVEAARAGEQGRGFAVVASEVRALAQRSSEAAREIRGLIQESSQRVLGGTQHVEQAGATMNDIVTSVQQVTDLIRTIAAASQEQARGLTSVTQATTQMEHVTQQNTALVEEVAAAAAQLETEATRLHALMDTFQLEQTMQTPVLR